MSKRIAAVIIGVNSVVSAVVWLPAWIKMWHTHSSRDYALASLLLIFWLQLSNLYVACVEKSRRLGFYLIVNTLTVGFTCGMVWWFQR